MQKLQPKVLDGFFFIGDEYAALVNQVLGDSEEIETTQPSFSLIQVNDSAQGKGYLILNCAGTEIKIDWFTFFASQYQDIEELDLRSTTLARGENGHALCSFFLRNMPNLKRVYLDGATWLGDLWNDSPSNTWGTRNIENYFPFFEKIAFVLADPNVKECSLEEIRRFAREVLQAPTYLLKLSSAAFLTRFPTIERIVCTEDQEKTDFFWTKTSCRLVDDDLRALFESIPKNHPKIGFVLSGCPLLTVEIFNLIGDYRSKISYVSLLRNPCLKQVLHSHLVKLEDLIRIDNPTATTLDAATFSSWVENYPKEKSDQDAAQALFKAHPNINSLDFSRSKIEKELVSIAIQALGLRCKKIDLTDTPQLTIDTLTTIEIFSKNLESLHVVGNKWIELIWKLEESQFDVLKPVLLKIVYPLAKEKEVSLKEIYGWGQILGAKKEHFSRFISLFFDRFPLIETIDCSSSPTTTSEFIEIVTVWPVKTGSLKLCALSGLNERIFPEVLTLLPNLGALYVDEKDGIILSAPIRKTPRATGLSLIPKLALQSGPEGGKLSYAMIEKWKWLVEKFHEPTQGELFSFCVGHFFSRYQANPIRELDFSNSPITDEQLQILIEGYRKVYPNGTFSLCLNKCPNLTQACFEKLYGACSATNPITSLSFDEGTPFAEGIQAVHMDLFWEKLVFTPSVSETLLYSELLRWHALMGSGANWRTSCDRFFTRFPALRQLDLQRQAPQQETLGLLFASWAAHLQEGARLRFNFSHAPVGSRVVEELHHHLKEAVEEVNLAGNEWMTDAILARLISLPNLKKLEIGGCSQVSAPMMGLCEPLLGAQQRLVKISYSNLAPFFQQTGDLKAVTSYFLHHPQIQTIDLGSSLITHHQFCLIAAGIRQAREQWEAQNWIASIDVDHPDWKSRAEIESISLAQCQNLDLRTLFAVQNSFRDLPFLDLSYNPWVFNSGIEYLALREKELKIDVYGCKNITQDITGRLFAPVFLRAESANRNRSTIGYQDIKEHISQNREAARALFDAFYRQVWPRLEVEGPICAINALTPYRATALFSLVGERFKTGMSEDDTLSACKALATKIGEVLEERRDLTKEAEQAKFLSEIEAMIEASFFLLEVQSKESNAFLKLGHEVTGSSPIVVLQRPHWEVPIERERSVTIPQITHEITKRSGLEERAKVVKALFTAFSEKVLPNLKASSSPIAIVDWEKRVSSLLPYQKEALSPFLKGEKTEQAALAVCNTLLAESPNVVSEETLAQSFSRLEAAIEIAFFVLEAQGSAKAFEMRKAIEQESLAVYSSLFRKEHWNLETAFLDRAAIALGIPTFDLETKRYLDQPLETRLTNWLERVEVLKDSIADTSLWKEAWAFWTKQPVQLPTTAEAERVLEEIRERVKEMKKFLYGTPLFQQLLGSFPWIDKVDLGKGKITPMQLEGILHAVGKRKVDLDLSYNPLLSGEHLLGLFKVLCPKFRHLRLDGNLWVNERLIKELASYADSLSTERCVHIPEEFVRVDPAPWFTMSDEQTTAQPVHITRIRSLLPQHDSLSERYRLGIRNQRFGFTNVNCSGSDIDDKEWGYLLKELQGKLANTADSIAIDLSYCDKLNPSALREFSRLEGKLAFLHLGGNRWVNCQRLLDDFLEHTKGLRLLNLIDCPDISLDEVDRFAEAFFAAREREILLSLQLAEPPLANAKDNPTVTAYRNQTKALYLDIITLKFEGRPLSVRLQKGEKYGDKLHEAMLHHRAPHLGLTQREQASLGRAFHDPNAEVMQIFE